MSSYDIRACSANSHIEQARALLDLALGDGYITEEGLKEYALSDEKVCFVAVEDGVIIGVATAEIITQAHLAGPTDQHPVLMGLGLRGPVGVIKSAAVAPVARGRGLGTELVRRRLEWMQSRGVEAAICCAWVDSATGLIAARSPLERCGFNLRITAPNFWQVESAQQGYDCPACGTPCLCSAAIFAVDQLGLMRSQSKPQCETRGPTRHEA